MQSGSGAGMTKHKATAIGFSAVLMWSLLALLTIGSAPVPPLLLNALCFGIGGVLGLVWTARRGFHVLRAISWKVYAFGTAGLFSYHLLYFTAFRLGPDATTGLIAYLWPLFIVLLSGMLPGEKLRLPHVLGALIALGGAAVIVLGTRTESGGANFVALGLAFLCALTWAGYSVLSRRLGGVSRSFALPRRRCRDWRIWRWKKPFGRRALLAGLRSRPLALDRSERRSLPGTSG